MKTLTLVLVGAAALSVGACTPPNARYNPFIVGPEAVTSVRTIAVLGPQLPDNLPDRARLAAQFDSTLTTQLTAAGYVVIPSGRTDSIWHAFADTAKLYNQQTGEFDDAKASMLLRAISKEVRARFAADALLVSDLRLREAAYNRGWCSWDGSKEYVQTKGELLMNALMGTWKTGSLPALSFRATLVDSAGRDIYRNYGGIAALKRMTAKGPADVDQAEALGDAERNRNAVRLALQPLAKTDR